MGRGEVRGREPIGAPRAAAIGNPAPWVADDGPVRISRGKSW
jgi:hypothetical protein